MKSTILVVDDELVLRKALEKFLTDEDYNVITAGNADEALLKAQTESITCALVDLVLPGIKGVELVRKLKEISPDMVCIVMTGFGTISSAVEAMRSGAFHYLTKPFELDDIRQLVAKAIEHQKLKTENQELRFQLQGKYKFDNIIGQSSGMQGVFQLISKVADTDSTVLVLGESGTGKEMVARAMHYNSSRANHPLITVNCAAIPEELLEAELFGHLKGSFTGAIATRIGRFEAAHGGTIFLDEIGDMSPKLQVKLLRVLQERKFEPVGSTQSKKIDVRIIAATHQDLDKAMRQGRFREDLYYRLNVIPVKIPALRERNDDIPLLAKHFLDKYNNNNGRRVEGFTQRALDTMQGYPWPGNVRELENLVERIVVLKGGGDIDVEDLPGQILNRKPQYQSPDVDIPEDGLSFKHAVSSFENALILRALEKTGGNKNKAASLLKLNRTTLVEKIKKKQLDKEFANQLDEVR